MRSFRTKVESKSIKQKKPKKKSSHDYDELCDTPGCDHMLRNHVEGSVHGAVCGVYPCACLVFTPSERYYNWNESEPRIASQRPCLLCDRLCNITKVVGSLGIKQPCPNSCSTGYL